MKHFFEWMEARIPKPKVLDKASAYSSFNLPKTADRPYTTADQLLKAFEAGNNVPPEIIADTLEEEGHPNAVFFRSPDMMAKAHFYMALPNNAWREGWNDPSHAQFKNYLLDRYRKFFAGSYKPNYRSTKGQQAHGQYISFFHDLIHNPNRIPPDVRNG